MSCTYFKRNPRKALPHPAREIKLISQRLAEAKRDYREMK